MKKVLIPLAIAKLNPNTIAPLHCVRETFLRKLNKYGASPLFVSGIMTAEAVDELYNMAGGVLCTGGSDLAPARYNAAAHPKTEALEPARDEIELQLAKRAIADKKPYLGICRGCQVLAVATGGTLHQHLPEAFPQEDHGTSEGPMTYDDLATREKHKVLLEAGSRMSALLGGVTEARINSGHHQAIATLGEGLRIAGKSPAGVIEVVESAFPDHFCFAIQGHPEAEESGDFEKVFQAFVEALK